MRFTTLSCLGPLLLTASLQLASAGSLHADDAIDDYVNSQGYKPFDLAQWSLAENLDAALTDNRSRPHRRRSTACSRAGCCACDHGCGRRRRTTRPIHAAANDGRLVNLEKGERHIVQIACAQTDGVPNSGERLFLQIKNKQSLLDCSEVGIFSGQPDICP